ncbi:MAG: hypothetical protein EPN36_14150 [Rhodanobacteraceae bacterium]|nr:MAG: hypothetical protein EPN36_14150 [Rhodanobacteraceae bacterium]
MKFADTIKFSSQVATAYVAAKTVRLIAGRNLEGAVYARIGARRFVAETTALAVPTDLTGGQRARIVVAESIYLSMRGHPLMWTLAAGCACFWIVTAIKAVA